MQASVEFTQLTPYNIEGAVFGEATNTKVTVLRLIGGTDDWQMVKGTRAIVIGGDPAVEELRKALDSENGGYSRARLNKLLNGLTSRTHSRVREFCGL